MYLTFVNLANEIELTLEQMALNHMGPLIRGFFFPKSKCYSTTQSRGWLNTWMWNHAYRGVTSSIDYELHADFWLLTGWESLTPFFVQGSTVDSKFQINHFPEYLPQLEILFLSLQLRIYVHREMTRLVWII